MPRALKDSDDDTETKIGRRTRGIASSVTSSPLRRSSRIRRPAHQDGSSPESLTEANIGTSTRRRTGTMESGASEQPRSLRSRKNSVSSDISEISEFQSTVDTPQKRSTRRSFTAQLADTPESTTRARRSSRAGSESKSTPPVVRARRTRANSVESEPPVDTLLKKELDTQSTTVPTNTKIRRRASVMPSEPVLAEEAEEVKSAIPEVSDSLGSENGESHNLSSSIKKASKSMSANTSLEAVDEEMTVEESSAKDSVCDSSEISLSQKDEASPSDVPAADTKSTTPKKSEHSISIETVVEIETTVTETLVNNRSISATPPKRHSLTLKETSKELGLKIESLLNKSSEKQETSPGNKENEKGNIVTDTKFERNLETVITNVVSTGKKSLGSIQETPSKEKHNLSADDRLLSNISEFKNTPKETVPVHKSFDNVEELDSAKSMVLTRKRSLKDKVTEEEASNLSSQKNESYSEPMEVDEVIVENVHEIANDKVTLQVQGDIVLKEAFVKLNKMELDSELTNENDKDSEPVKLQQNSNEVSEAEKLVIDVDPDNKSATNSESPSTIVKSNTVCQLREKFLTNLENKTISSRRTIGEVVQKHSTDSQQRRLSLNISNLESHSPTNNSQSPENIQEDKVEISRDPSTEKENPTKNVTMELNEYVTDCSMSDTISIRNVSLDPNEKSSITDSPIRIESSNGDELSCTIKNTKSSIVPDLTGGLTQGESVNEIGISVSSTSNSPSKTIENTAKSQSATSPQVDNNKSQCIQEANADNSDLDSNIGNLFQDIPADEWEKVKNKKGVECESSSMHSVSTERLENESEAECDLILVDREAWHAAENEKLSRKNQKFDYDSDDTIIMKTRMLQSEVKKGEKQTQLEVVMEEDPTEMVTDNEASKITDKQSSAKKQFAKEETETLNSSKRKSVERRKSTTSTNIDDADSAIVNDGINTLNVSARKSLSNRKSLNKTRDSSCGLNTSHKSENTAAAKNKAIVMLNNDDSDDELNMNSSQGESSMTRKSFNKLQNSLNISKKGLDKSNKSMNLNLSENSKDNPINESIDVSTRKSLKRKPINNIIELNSTSSSDEEQFVLHDVNDDESNRTNISSRKSLSNKKSLNTSQEKKSTSRIEKQQNDDKESSNNLSDESSVPLKSLNKSRESKTVDEKPDEQETSCTSSSNINVSTRKSADLRRSLNKSTNAKSLESSEDQDQGNKADDSIPGNVNSSSRKSTEIRKSLNASQKNSTKKLVAEEAVIMMDTESDNEVGKEDEEMEENNMENSAAETKSHNSSKNVSVVKKTKRLIAFNEEESSDDDFSAKFSEDDSNDNVEKNKSKNTSLKMIRGKTNNFKKNYSTVAHYGSDLESGSSSDEFEKQIPSFLFNASTSDDEDDTENNMDVDIAREMNLNGDTSLKYSDDDVPADDCRDSESEYSDSDDNGSDLADFVVGDDEIVEDEEDTEEGMEEETDDDSINEEEDDILEESSNSKKKKKYNRIALRVDSENEEDDTEPEDVDKEQEEESEIEMEQVSKSRLSTDKNISTSLKKNKTLDEPEEIIESKIDLDQSRKSLTKKQRKSFSSMECSTPISTLAKEKTNEKRTNHLTPNDSLLDIVATEIGFAKKKSLSSQTLADVKTPMKTASSPKEKEMPSFKTLKALQQSLPIDPPDIIEATNLSRKKSLKVDTLNKSMATPNSETPLTKYLKKQKLNESLPLDIRDEKSRKLKRKSMIQQKRSMAPMDIKLSTKDDNQESNVEEAMDEAEDVLDTDVQKQKGSQAREMVTVEKDGENTEEIVNEKRVNSKKSKNFLRREKKRLAKELSRTLSIEQTETEDSSEQKKTCNEKRNVETVNSTTNEDSPSINSSEVESKKKKKKKKKSNKEKQESEISQKVEQEKSLSKEALENIETREFVEEDDNVALAQKSNKKQRKNKKKKKKNLSEEISANENEEPSEESLVHNNKKERKRKLQEATISAQPEADKIVVEESTSKKRAKKQTQVLKSQETEIQKIVSNVDSSSDASDAPESVAFAKARQAAVLEMKNAAASIKAGKVAKKNNTKHNKKFEHDKQMKVEKLEKLEKVFPAKQSLKRLSDDVIENISDVPTRPQKRRKVSKSSKKEEKILPSRSMFSPNKSSNCHVEAKDVFIPLSSSGGTTQFQVVNLEKIKKNQKKVAAALFRERMLSRNRRQQVSAYLMYHQKQKASGKDKFPKPT